MQRTRSITSSLVIGLTLLVLGSITTASKASAPEGSQGSGSGEFNVRALPSSNAEQLKLSRYLKAKGALFYGAWWCPACGRQKALFGKEAALELPYIECDKKPTDRDVCIAAEIKAFPTWELKGKERLVGVQSLDELKAWSGWGQNN